MLVYLIRHGQTAHNAEGRIQGWLDVPLNAEGIEQARRLALRLAVKPINVVYASPLSRAQATARALTDMRGAQLILDERLREYNMGDWTGKTGDEIAASSPEFKQDGPQHQIPGGESAQQMHDRVSAFIEQLMAEHGTGKSHVAVVSHGGTLGACVGAMLGMPVARRHPFTFGNTSITEMQWIEGRWRMRTHNDRHHLRVDA